jgi:hydroxyacylglutathione hydrolase
MFFQQILNPDLSIYSYVVGDIKTKHCAVIDPPRLIEPFIELTKRSRLQISYILETHVHADFVSGAKELKNYFNEEPIICCSAMGGPEWIPQYAENLINDGDEIRLGTLKLKALHTPGHTPEHITWLCYDDGFHQNTPKIAFTGDMLFVGAVGRPDLLGEQSLPQLCKELYQSLFVRMAPLPDAVEVYPAHGAGSLCSHSNIGTAASSTLGSERRHNPELAKKPEERWIEELRKKISSPPQAFRRIKQINLQGAPLLKTLHKPKPLSVQELKKMAGAYTIDIRDPQNFAQGHLKGTINIPMGSSFANWAAMVVPDKIPLVLIVPEEHHVQKVVQVLWLMGFDDIPGYILWDDIAENAIQDVQTLSMVTVEEVVEKIDELHIIDVRTPAEWNAGHIEGAQHLELVKFTQMLQDVPKDANIVVTCGSGNRSSIAASILQKAGTTQIAHLKGGMQAWKKAGEKQIKG